MTAAIYLNSADERSIWLVHDHVPRFDFFEKVIVNADDKALRENRLKLLAEIRAATLTVADFSKIAG